MRQLGHERVPEHQGDNGRPRYPDLPPRAGSGRRFLWWIPCRVIGVRARRAAGRSGGGKGMQEPREHTFGEAWKSGLHVDHRPPLPTRPFRLAGGG